MDKRKPDKNYFYKAEKGNNSGINRKNSLFYILAKGILFFKCPVKKY